MAKALKGEHLNAVVLYMVNVSQPIRDDDIVGSLRGTKRFSSWNQETIFGAVRDALSDLMQQGLVRQDPNDRYSATYSGIQFLTERKMAFPRDKNRLYFLKEALRRRG
jgi:hypothetical protein